VTDLLRRAHRIGAGWLLLLAVAAAAAGSVGGAPGTRAIERFAGAGPIQLPEAELRGRDGRQVARPAPDGAPVVTARRHLEPGAPRPDPHTAAVLAAAPAPAWPARPVESFPLPRPDAAPARTWRAGYPRAPPMRAVETPAAA